MENVQTAEGGLIMENGAQKGIEVEGSNVEDAIKKAAEILNLSREEIDIKIVCEEKRGLFGMAGAKPAKIKAAPKEKNNNA